MGNHNRPLPNSQGITNSDGSYLSSCIYISFGNLVSSFFFANNLPDEMLTMEQVLEKFQSNVKKMKEKLDEITTGTPKKSLEWYQLV